MPVLIYPWRIPNHSVLRAAGLRLLRNIPTQRVAALRDGTLRNSFRFRGVRNEFGRRLIVEQDAGCARSILSDPRAVGIVQLAPGSEPRLDVLAAWQSDSIAAWARPGLLDVLEHGSHLRCVPMRSSCIDQACVDDPQVATAMRVVACW